MYAGCPEGSFWNDCLEKCPCANGGICELDGSCICPQGLTGPNCTKKGISSIYCVYLNTSTYICLGSVNPPSILNQLYVCNVELYGQNIANYSKIITNQQNSCSRFILYTLYVVVEVRMRTLDQFFEIEILTYSDITSLRLSRYRVLERKTLLRQSYRA